MRIQDICIHHVAQIAATQPLIEAATLMRERHVGNLVVVDNMKGPRRPIGVITDRDLVVAVVAAGLSADTLLVADVMTKPVYCCSGTQTVFDAIAIMREQGVRRLPVLNEAGELFGIIAADDIWTALADQMKVLAESTSRVRAKEEARRA